MRKMKKTASVILSSRLSRSIVLGVQSSVKAKFFVNKRIMPSVVEDSAKDGTVLLQWMYTHQEKSSVLGA
jgi:hypothetical protein